MSEAASYGATVKTKVQPVTVPRLRELKARGEKIAMLTAYDYTFARAIDAAGVDMVLVGDSLGMVVQGGRSTLGVTVAHIAYHTEAVARGLDRALLVADLPLLSYATFERALDASLTVLRAGAAMVKLEGAGPMLNVITELAARDVPVCGHLGLTPQSMHKLGGFRLQGREAAAAEQLLRDAERVAQAGADLLVLECVPSELALQITQAIKIPTIGIGAGVHCDGQVLVLHDALGLAGKGRRPRFVKDFMAGQDSIRGALVEYVRAVKAGEFPGPEHAY